MIKFEHFTGNWDVEMINEGTCEQAPVSTLAECKEAALKLGESMEVADRWEKWPYCYEYYGDICFDSKGAEDGRPARLNKFGRLYGLCKNGTVHTTCPLLHLY